MPEIVNKAGFVISVGFPVEPDIKEDGHGSRCKTKDDQCKRGPRGSSCQAPPIKHSVQRRSNHKRQQILLTGYGASQAETRGDAA